MLPQLTEQTTRELYGRFFSVVDRMNAYEKSYKQSLETGCSDPKLRQLHDDAIEMCWRRRDAVVPWFKAAMQYVPAVPDDVNVCIRDMVKNLPDILDQEDLLSAAFVEAETCRFMNQDVQKMLSLSRTLLEDVIALHNASRAAPNFQAEQGPRLRLV